MRTWQIWLVFTVSLVVALAGMAWLTSQALRLDAEQAESQAAAALEEKVNLALWRMDSMLMPLIAQEVARPYAEYAPYYFPPEQADSETSDLRISSPLINANNDYVFFNFEWATDGEISSPQAPPGDLSPWAVDNGLTPQAVEANRRRLEELNRTISREALLAQLPEQSLPRQALANEAFSPADAPTPGPPAPTNEQFLQNAGIQDAIRRSRKSGDGAARKGKAPSVPTALKELEKRDERFQSLAQQTWQSQRPIAVGAQQRATAPSAQPVVEAEGISRALWIDDYLLLARRVRVGGEVVVQGCRLNWTRLEKDLLAQVADLLPGAKLVPVRGDRYVAAGRLLAGLPVELIAPPAAAVTQLVSPVKISIAIAWGAVLLATAAVGMLLRGVILLSERRAAFVSAVTHELRTPLTTFRMYTEMLEQGMVTEPAHQQEYLRTLNDESARLSHLVENVLAYARLERGRRGGPAQRVAVGELFDRLSPRLAKRSEQAGMQLVCDWKPAVRAVQLATDASAVEQILFNLVDNAAKYAASPSKPQIDLSVRSEGRLLLVEVRDYGPGIDRQQARRLFRPFSKSAETAARSAPGVGLGLALSRRLARQLGGELTFEAAQPGARFVLVLPAQPSGSPYADPAEPNDPRLRQN